MVLRETFYGNKYHVLTRADLTSTIISMETGGKKCRHAEEVTEEGTQNEIKQLKCV